MKIKILQNLNCTIYAAHLHNLSTFSAQFVQIFTFFFQKFQTKILYVNTLTMQKLFLPAQIIQLSTPFLLIINHITPAQFRHSPA